MSKTKKLSYALFGGGGAAGSLLANQACLGSCSGCFSCVAFGGLLVSLALFKTLYKPKGNKHGLAATDH
jgi:hypothetical protein